VTLPAAAVTDPAGNPNTAAASFDFFTLAGDANRDRVVNFTDLLTVARNYNKTPATWADGDFNYDGLVNFTDLLIVARAYNQSLPTPPPPAAAPAMASSESVASTVLQDGPDTSVFSTTRLARPAPAKPKVTARPSRG
jgi:hypothetical protein